MKKKKIHGKSNQRKVVGWCETLGSVRVQTEISEALQHLRFNTGGASILLRLRGFKAENQGTPKPGLDPLAWDFWP